MKTNLRTSVVLLVALVILASCQNSETEKEEVDQITLVTNRSHGRRVTMAINADPSEQPNIWIDKNLNGQCDEGEQVTHFVDFCNTYPEYKVYEKEGVPAFSPIIERRKINNSSLVTFKPVSDTIVIYGKVQQLSVNGLNLVAMDLSKCKSIKALDCSLNNLKSLSLTNNSSLRLLDISNNPITEIEFPERDSLEMLYASSTGFTNLKLNSTNSTLKYVHLVNSRQLKELDLSNQASLEKVNLQWCYALEKLDLSGCSSLETLNCLATRASQGLSLQGCALKHLTLVSPKETENCAEESSFALDLTPLSSLQKATISLDGSNTKASLDVSGLKELRSLTVYENSLVDLILKGNASLEALSVSGNNIKHINTQDSPKLSYILASDNEISEIDLSPLANLEYLNLENNKIHSLDVSKNQKVNKISLSGNMLDDDSIIRFIKTLPDRTGQEEGILWLRYGDDGRSDVFVGLRDLKEQKNWSRR